MRAHVAENPARRTLDEALARVDLLTFDLDVDRERLEAAGDGSRMIPLVAVPDAAEAAQRNALRPVRCWPMTRRCTSFVPSYVYTVSRLHMWRITG